ncbi:hypothetical protein [Flavobacterium sp.]
MKENKNIDQFFKESFEHFEVNPPEEIWHHIEEKLQKKKKRRVIPIWWFSSGVAALLVLGLLVFNAYYTLEIHAINDVVIDENIPNKVDNHNIISSEKENKTEIVSSGDSKKQSLEKTNISTNNVYTEKEISVINSNPNIVSIEKNLPKAKRIPNSRILVNSPKKELLNSNSNPVFNNESEDKVVRENISNNSSKIAQFENLIFSKQENSALDNSIFNKEKTELHNENNIVQGKIAMKNHDNVATKGEVNTSNDSTEIATVASNELEELLNEKENKIAQEQKMSRWQVTPNLAPIYFGSAAKGSPLDSNLDENTKSFNTNISYGIAVNYSVNKKVKIRTGINSFTVDYNTNDIMFFQSNNAKMMKNIDPSVTGSLIEIVPLKNINPFFNRLETEQNTGILNQKMGYIEMPIEISYTIVNKKYGIEILGGISTMFLSKNEIFLEAEGMNIKIGEASNLNPVHFSSNIGVGLTYGFFKNFQARIEPTFKYQINTFSRDSQNFKPYIMGIYSGVSYNF